MLSKFSVTALIASGALLMGAASVAAESSDPIKIAINSWTGQHLSAHISGSVLQKAGYNVEYVTAGAVPQYAAISQGNIHLQPEAWGNNVGAIYENAVASGDIIKLGSLGLKPVEGWMYPPYMKEQCPGLPAVEALMKCAQVFATAETFPKARLITYPADWGTRSKDLVKKAGWPIHPIAGGSEGAMIAEMNSAQKSKKPILVMFWLPHWIHTPYDWEFVDMSSLNSACETTEVCGFKQADITKIVSGDFEAKWPGAFKIMQKLSIDNATMNALMLEVDNKERELEDVVSEWMSDNTIQVQSWVAAG